MQERFRWVRKIFHGAPPTHEQFAPSHREIQKPPVVTADIVRRTDDRFLQYLMNHGSEAFFLRPGETVAVMPKRNRRSNYFVATVEKIKNNKKPPLTTLVVRLETDRPTTHQQQGARLSLAGTTKVCRLDTKKLTRWEPD